VGGGMKFVPSARPDDGFLEAIVACGVTRGKAVRELTRIHRGGHLANPKIVLKKGTVVRVETIDQNETLTMEADGDVRGNTPAEFRLMPAALGLVW
jgi:diacylglycerol kinase (ATP)